MFRYALLSLAAGLASARFTDEDPYLPKWSPVYEVEGVIYHHSGMQEPFKAWYDINKHKSRIDYFGGTVRTFQNPNPTKPEDGLLIKTVPMTTETALNQPRCFSELAHITGPQSALPDTTNFTRVDGDNDYVHDFKAYKWQRQVWEEVGNVTRRHEYALWVRYDNLEGYGLMAAPLRYEVHSYNVALGTQYSYYYLEYTHYKVLDEIPSAIFEDWTSVKPVPPCVTPRNQRDYIVNVNPMHEFMDQHHQGRRLSTQFDLFKTAHGRQYDSEIEHEERMDIFRNNLRYIESHNRAGRGYELAVNSLADRTEEELAALTGLRYDVEPGKKGLPFPYSAEEIWERSSELPEQFDWRPYGAVTPVKDQMTCGSCWAFAAVGAVEGAMFLHSGQQERVRLSEQALMDCSWGFENQGCDGGNQRHAYSWIAKHGLPTYEAYGGYLGEDGSCHVENVTRKVFIKDFVNVLRNDENALRVAIFGHGPIAVGIYAPRTPSFLFYSRGVYYEPEYNNIKMINHAVLAVGYGVLDGQSYWLIKNSWGQEWGNGGYILMSTKDNNCGVQSDPTYVVMRN